MKTTKNRSGKAPTKRSAKARKKLTAYCVENPDVGYGYQLDLKCGTPQLVIYQVWTVGLYKNGHPQFDLRAVATDSITAKMYSEILRRDKEINGETWYRIHIEPRVANHLYGECMREYREATGRLIGSPSSNERLAIRASLTPTKKT